MHLSDGILTGPMMAATAGLAAAGIAQGLRKMEVDHIPRTGIVAAVFFVASLIHVPIGPVSAHLVLAGLTGLLLGWRAFPAIAAALLLQVVFFGFGGLTSLGANAVNMALPAVLCHAICGPALRATRSPSVRFVSAAVAGALGVLLSGLMVAATLFLCGREFTGAALALLAAHVPVMVVEGLVTGAAIVYLYRVAPNTIEELDPSC